MEPATKAKLLGAMASLFGIIALGLAVLAFVLIKGGAYPTEGTGSLGHVGMVIAGIIVAFLVVTFGGLALFCVSKRRVVTRASEPAADTGAHE